MALSLCSLGLILPHLAYAGFFADIWTNNASASTQASGSIFNNSNSQNIPILEAAASAPGGAGSKNRAVASVMAENVNIEIVSDSALYPNVGPMSDAVGGSTATVASPDQVSVYVVRKGDTVSAVADMFGVSSATVLSANDLKKGQKLVEGDVLVILPISGVEHTVTKGQTLKGLANLYKISAEDIAEYNGLTTESKLAMGDSLFIPGADILEEAKKPASNLATAAKNDANYYANNPIKSASGYFINPLPTGRKTQGLHGTGKRGIDIGAPTGSPIYASASGTVLIAKTGWSGGYGNMVIVQHPNGTRTLYAHMSKLGTSTGAKVTQGEIIGYVGSTGRSTGPHLHFEVFNAKNPGADWSWKK